MKKPKCYHQEEYATLTHSFRLPEKATATTYQTAFFVPKYTAAEMNKNSKQNGQSDKTRK